MRIITLTCSACGSIVAGNVLEKRRNMKCPRNGCDQPLRFTDLDEDEQEHLVANREKYNVD